MTIEEICLRAYEILISTQKNLENSEKTVWILFITKIILDIQYQGLIKTFLLINLIVLLLLFQLLELVVIKE